MRQAMTIAVLMGSWAASTVFAQQPAADAALQKHQIASCMSRRMAADRLLSFNEAAKACKDSLKSRKTDTAANVQAKPLG